MLALDDVLIERIEAAASDTPALRLLERLPSDQPQAVTARIVDELGYDEIAARMQCSESVARKRVSRALTKLRARLKKRS